MSTKTPYILLRICFTWGFLLSACNLPSAASTRVFYVSTTGNDSNNCLSSRSACRTLTTTVERATPGSTVNLAAGTYIEAATVWIQKNLVLQGANRDTTIISTPRTRESVMIIDAASVRLQNLGFTGASASNSAVGVQNGANVVLEVVTIRDNPGMGVFAAGSTVTLIESMVTGNRDGIVNFGGILQVQGSVFRGNSFNGLFNTGTASITNSIFEQNASRGTGGGYSATIVNERRTSGLSTGTANMTITGTSIANNTGHGITNNAGRISISNVNIARNQGGLLNFDGVVILQSSVVESNQGGGVDISNSASTDAVLESTETAIINNRSSGLSMRGGAARLTNVTISGNPTGVAMNGGDLLIKYSTVAFNNGPGLEMSLDAEAIIQNSIIALNTSGRNCVYSFPAHVARDYVNFACDDTITAAALRLGPLSPAAGTFLHPLLLGSPAIDRASGPCPAQDQRNYRRPYNSVCDVGAYEFGSSMAIEAATPGILVIASETPALALNPTDTSEPGSLNFILTVKVAANCRAGPDIVYPVVNSVLVGQQVQVIGKNEDGTWWYSQLADDKCWISNIAGTPQGNLTLLSIIPAPPTPVATEPPVEEKPTDDVITDPDNDGDGYPLSMDCDDKDAKINPDAFESPGDKIDSNCNGDDDK